MLSKELGSVLSAYTFQDDNAFALVTFLYHLQGLVVFCVVLSTGLGRELQAYTFQDENAVALLLLCVIHRAR